LLISLRFINVQHFYEGSLGLFLGASILSLMEVFDVLFRIIHLICLKKTKSNQVFNSK